MFHCNTITILHVDAQCSIFIYEAPTLTRTPDTTRTQTLTQTREHLSNTSNSTRTRVSVSCRCRCQCRVEHRTRQETEVSVLHRIFYTDYFFSLISGKKNCCIGCDFLSMQQLESDKPEVQKCTANAYKVSKMQQCYSFEFDRESTGEQPQHWWNSRHRDTKYSHKQ